MRCLFGGILAALLLLPIVAVAQEANRLPAFPLTPVKADDTSKLRRAQVDLLNSATEELASAYGRFTEGQTNTRELLEASERVLTAAKDAFARPADHVNFASKHYSLATAIEAEVLARSTTPQDARLAKQLKLGAEIALLKASAPAVAAVVPAPGVPAPGVPAPRVPAPRVPSVTPPVSPQPDPAPSKMLDPIAEEELAAVNALLLDVRSHASMYEFYLSDDGRHAVVMEGGREQPRYALWDFEKGKLLRYLSAQQDRETKEYKGDDDADFGAQVVFAARGVRKMVFSPDGKLIVGMTEVAPPPVPEGGRPREEILVWELSSGRLIRSITTTHHHPHTFYFVNDKQIATKAFSERGVSIELIDATTGEVEYLMEPNNFEMYGNALHDGKVAFMMPRGGPVMVDLKTKEQTHFLRPPDGSSRMAASRTWFSTDGEQLFAQKAGLIEVWDVSTKSLQHEFRVAPDNRSYDLNNIATGANIVARRVVDARKIELVDVAEGETQTSIVGSPRFEVSGISRDATRLVLPTADRKMLVVHFPDGPPAGEIQFKDLLRKAGEKALR